MLCQIIRCHTQIHKGIVAARGQVRMVDHRKAAVGLFDFFLRVGFARLQLEDTQAAVDVGLGLPGSGLPAAALAVATGFASST